MGAIDETGKRYGKLVVLKRDYTKPKSNKSCYWLCQCDCGNQTIVLGTKLRKGETKSCGCLVKEVNRKNAIDMTNKKFGKLTVIERAGSTSGGIAKWLCQCECGNKTIVLGSHLRNGHTTSCGCVQKEKASQLNIKDITNNRYGKLTAIKRLNKKQGTNYIWLCQCDCGNTCEVDVNSLSQGKINSCGCLNTSKGEYIIEKILIDNNISFEKQKTFESCRSPKTNALFKFDFYINNSYIIEFDGEQHFTYKKDNGWNNKDNFEKTKYNDYCKNAWCKNNNVPLIRIPYWHLNEITIADLKLETSKYIIKEN